MLQLRQQLLFIIAMLAVFATFGCKQDRATLDSTEQKPATASDTATKQVTDQTKKEPSLDDAAVQVSTQPMATSPEAPNEQDTVGVAATAEQILKRRQQLDATVLSKETAAQKYEQSFVQLWDALLREDPYTVMKRFQFNRLIVGKPQEPDTKNWGVPGIRIVGMGEPATSLDHSKYEAVLDELSEEGWQIIQTEWHHSKFAPDETAAPQSTISFEVHLHHAKRKHRLLARGKLRVEWSEKLDAKGNPIADVIDATDVQLIDQLAAPMFTTTTLDPKKVAPNRLPRVSPLIIYDVDGDGLSEIILAGCNKIYLNRGGDRFEPEDFLKHGLEKMSEAGIMADFTGDGLADFIGASLGELQLRLFTANAEGTVYNGIGNLFPQDAGESARNDRWGHRS